MTLNEKRIHFLNDMIESICQMDTQIESLHNHHDLRYFSDRDLGISDQDDYSYLRCLEEACDLLTLARSICRSELNKYLKFNDISLTEKLEYTYTHLPFEDKLNFYDNVVVDVWNNANKKYELQKTDEILWSTNSQDEVEYSLDDFAKDVASLIIDGSIDKNDLPDEFIIVLNEHVG